MYIYIYIVKVTLTSARCDTVSHKTMIFRQVQRTVVFGFYKFRCRSDGRRRTHDFAWLSNVSTFSSRHKLHNPSLASVRLTQLFPRDRVLDLLFLSFHIYFDNSVSICSVYY